MSAVRRLDRADRFSLFGGHLGMRTVLRLIWAVLRGRVCELEISTWAGTRSYWAIER